MRSSLLTIAALSESLREVAHTLETAADALPASPLASIAGGRLLRLMGPLLGALATVETELLRLRALTSERPQ